MTLEATSPEIDFHETWEGKNLTPFLGLQYAPSPDVALGLETRLPILLFDQKGDDSDGEKGDDDDGGGRVPLYHLVALSVRL